MKVHASVFPVAAVLAVLAAACGKSSTDATEGSPGSPSSTGSVLGTAGNSTRAETPAAGSSAGPAMRSSTAGASAQHANAAGTSGTAAPGNTASADSGGQPQRGAAGSSAGSTAAVSDGAGAAGVGGSNSIAAGSGMSGSSGSVDTTALTKAMGFGANIGNTLENITTWETGWGQPMISKAYIDGMASHGIKTVRVPVAWDTYAANGVIDASKLARVKEVVSWIDAAGMYSIVNIHWDGGWIFNENKPDAYKLTDAVKTKFASYWKQIATGFSDVGHTLILEGLNEEGRFYVNGDMNGTPDIAALNELNQLFVTTVRAQAGFNATRALLIAGFNTDIAKTCVDAFTVPTDPAGPGKLFLSIHFYDPYTFTLMEDAASWGSPKDTWGTDAEKKALDDLFSQLGAFSTKKMIPVILGEFAVTRGMKVMRQPASRVLWMESVAKASMSRGMVPVLWDTGSEIMRSDGSLSSELQMVLNHLK